MTLFYGVILNEYSHKKLHHTYGSDFRSVENYSRCNGTHGKHSFQFFFKKD